MSKLTLAVLIGMAMAGMARAEEAAPEGWKPEIALGFTLTDGNSDTSMLTVNAAANRKWEEHEVLLGAKYAYGETDSETTTDNGEATAQYNYLFTERTYGYLKGAASYDDQADLDYRILLGPGVGYYFLKSDATALAGETGVAWRREKKGGEEDDAAVLRLAQRGEHKLSETSKIFESVEYMPNLDDFDLYLLTAEAGVEAALNASMNLRLVVQDKYDSDPAPDTESNDVTVTASLVWKI